MKRTILFIVFIACFAVAFPQVPGGINYQAVVRNSSGEIVDNQSVSFRLSVLSGSANGTIVYSEQHSANTNGFGLVVLKVGMGSVISGNFGGINWGSDSHFMKVEVDINGGSSYMAMGTSQLLAVPYALHSKTVENDKVDDSDSDPNNEIQELSLAGSTLSLSKSGKTVDLSSIGGGLSFPFTGEASSTEPGFRVNNTSEGPAIFGLTGHNNTNSFGIGGETTASLGAGVRGIATSTSGQAWGVYGHAMSPGGVGVAGYAKSTTGENYAIIGLTSSPDGYSGYFDGGKFYVGGLIGIGVAAPTTELDVNGQVRIRGGSPGAGKVLTSDASGIATWETPSGGGGLSLPFTGSGNSSGTLFDLTNEGSGKGLVVTSTIGSGEVYAILGKTSSSTGTGVRGEASATSGFSSGVEGTARSDVGHGVIGRAWSSSGGGVGVYGESRGPSGTGVLGVNTSGTGSTWGIRGQVESSTGFSGHFSGGKFHVSGNAGFGTENPTAQLEVAGQIKMTGGSPGVGKVLTSDANGLATWETPSGGNDLSFPYSAAFSSSEYGFSIENESGSAIRGFASGTSAAKVGVSGNSASPGGIGILGASSASTGEGYGVYASTNSPNGFGVYGGVVGTTAYSGYFNGGRFYISGNTGIGTETPSAKLEVSGQVKITGGNPGSGKVLTSDASGLATWETPSGGGGLTLPYSGDYSGSGAAFSISHSENPGLYVYNPATSGDITCINAWTNSSSGIGIAGYAGSTSGVNYGVKGVTSSSSGYSGYFDGGRFYASGNTGIGVANPDAKLDVNGQIKIRGGSPGAGKVLTSDASGLASWQAPSGGGGIEFPYTGSFNTSDNIIDITNSGDGGISVDVNSASGTTPAIYGSTNSPYAPAIYGANFTTDGVGVRGHVTSATGHSGYFEGGSFYVNGSIGIDVASPTAELDVQGQIKIRGGNPGAGKVLMSDASGLASWVTSPTSMWGKNGSDIYYNAGKVGMGTNSPGQRLEVNGNIALTSGSDKSITLPDGTKSLFIGGIKGETSAYSVHFITNSGSGGVERLSVISDKVGVGIVSPTQKLDVNGNIRVRSFASDGYVGSVNRKSDGSLTISTSDRRLKENIKTLEGSLDKVLQLRGVNFTWKSNPEYGIRVGFIAQEFEEVIPELVFTNPEDGFKGINYPEVSAVLVEAVKELKQENDKLKQENEEIKERLERLENVIQSIQTASR